MKEDDIKNMQELIKVCMELNRDDFHVFLSFSGHVNSYSVHYHHGGFDKSEAIYTGHCQSFCTAPETIELLKEASDNNQAEIERFKLEADKTEYLRLKKIFEGSN